MELKDRIRNLGKQMPKDWQKYLKELLSSAGEKTDAGYFLGVLLIASIVLFIVVLVISQTLGGFKTVIETVSMELSKEHAGILNIVLGIIASFIITGMIDLFVLSYYSLKADARRNAIESILPDFLSLVSANVRSGMPLDQALWQAAKPEFGVLGKEVKEAIKEAYSGKPLEDALTDLGHKFNSLMFRRILEILKQSIKSGGQVAVVLEKTANESRDVFILKRDTQATLIVYVIFLVFAASIGVPFLFAVSNQMLVVLTNAFSITQSLGEVSGNFISVSKPPIEPKHFYYFSIITIFISVTISSLIIGAAYTGNKRDGLKFLPFMIIIAYIVFYVAQTFLSIIFQNIAG